MSWVPIYDTSTGEILYQVEGSDDLVADNTPGGAAALDPVSASLQQDLAYVDDPGGTPTLADRPEMGASIPDSMFVSGSLEIADVPAGVAVEVTLNSTGTSKHSGSSVTLETYDATPASVSDGDILYVQLTGFPYQPMSGFVFVQADP